MEKDRKSIDKDPKRDYNITNDKSLREFADWINTLVAEKFSGPVKILFHRGKPKRYKKEITGKFSG